MAFGTVTGDLDALTRFGDAIGALGQQRGLRDLSRELGEEAVKLAEDGFRKERDPYGVPWYRKSYADGRKTLQGETGKLATSFAIKSVGAWGVVVGSSLARSRFQQSGTGVYGPRKAPIKPKAGKALAFNCPGGGMLFRASVKGQQQRRLVPAGGLPSPIWNRALKARVKAFLVKRLGKVGRAA